jgi:hypothetical protein
MYIYIYIYITNLRAVNYLLINALYLINKTCINLLILIIEFEVRTVRTLHVSRTIKGECD